MSYTHISATANLTVCDGFNIESYLNAISGRCVKEQNFIFENYGEEDGKVDLNFEKYVRQYGNKVLIEVDSEEDNYDSEVWDWLIDQFLPIMNSKFIEVKSASFDSREGVDCSISYYMKDGTFIGSDDIHKIVEQHFNLTP